MNEVSHGVDVDAEAARAAVEIGTLFLSELQALRSSWR